MEHYGTPYLEMNHVKKSFGELEVYMVFQKK